MKKTSFGSDSSLLSDSQNMDENEVAETRVINITEEDTRNLCRRKNCKYAFNKHRHSVANCKMHDFCCGQFMKASDGNQREQTEKMPLTGSREID